MILSSIWCSPFVSYIWWNKIVNRAVPQKCFFATHLITLFKQWSFSYLRKICKDIYIWDIKSDKFCFRSHTWIFANNQPKWSFFIKNFKIYQNWYNFFKIHTFLILLILNLFRKLNPQLSHYPWVEKYTSLVYKNNHN